MVQIVPVGSSARRAAVLARWGEPLAWLVLTGLQLARLALPRGRF